MEVNLVNPHIQVSWCLDVILHANFWTCSRFLLHDVGCQLKMKQDHHAVQNNTKVLQIEPENVKAIYHRGLAVVVLLSMNALVSG